MHVQTMQELSVFLARREKNKQKLFSYAPFLDIKKGVSKNLGMTVLQKNRIKIFNVCIHENSIFHSIIKEEIFYAFKDLASNSSTMRDFPALLYWMYFFPPKNIRMEEFRSPAVRNNLWDDKAGILNNQSHFLFSWFLLCLLPPHMFAHKPTN